MDENECQEELHNCHINSKCLNELGSFRCICDDNFVDNAALNNQRPGTDCQNPCFTSFTNSTISGKSKIYFQKYRLKNTDSVLVLIGRAGEFEVRGSSPLNPERSLRYESFRHFYR